MKSLFPLIILLVVCFSLSFFLRKDGFTQASELSESYALPTKESYHVLDSFLPFKRSTEPFKLRDEAGVEYELNEQEELYNVDGKLAKGKHDGTDYSSLLDDVRKDYENLRSQTPARCDESIKCIADFGTNVGEDLCCGQTGVLQDTRYVCPSNKPTCSKFKCGTEFGTCS